MLPKIFIGSSQEGLEIARTVFSRFEGKLLPTLWDQDLFLPGSYVLETLERELRKFQFAVLVATGDDQLIKRGTASAAIRDNLLVEFGLFAGALGRRRVFLMCPDDSKITIPSDLIGLLVAMYDAKRAALGGSETTAAIETPCRKMLAAIEEETRKIEQSQTGLNERMRASHQMQAIQRLQGAASSLRDALIAVQRDAFAALSNRATFDEVKRRATDHVDSMVHDLRRDAATAGAESELEELRARTHEALMDLPFPEEIAVSRSDVSRNLREYAPSALRSFLAGNDPFAEVQSTANRDVNHTLNSLRSRYSDWWDAHCSGLQQATARLQDKLNDSLLTVASEAMSLAASAFPGCR
jgi:hypothetical protein